MKKINQKRIGKTQTGKNTDKFVPVFQHYSWPHGFLYEFQDKSVNFLQNKTTGIFIAIAVNLCIN